MCGTAPQLVSQRFSGDFPNKAGDTVVLSCPPELSSKILLLKINNHTVVTGYEEIKLVLIKTFSPCRLECIELEGGMQVVGEKTHQQS